MNLKCFTLLRDPPPLVPARPSRKWMDEFPGRHAHRCLPLAIANTHGWEVLSPATFAIDWNGGPAAGDLVMTALDGSRWLEHFTQSNFTRGIVTMHTGYLFRTDPGWNLLASGPFNEPKDGIAPLTGLIETDWLPYPFTMNWQMTRPGRVVFEKGEPFCLVVPVPQGPLETVTPEIFELAADPELRDQHDAWREQRDAFMKSLRAGDQETLKQAWQRFYFLGKYPGSEREVPSHKSKIRLNAPVDRRKK